MAENNNKQNKRPKVKTFYSASPKVDMGALDMSFNSKDGSVYWRLAPQSGYNDSQRAKGVYDWKSAVNVKLDVGEVGAILRAIRTDSEFKFFHDFGGNKVSGSLKYWQTEKSRGFGVNVTKGDKPIRVSLSLGDAELMAEYLRFALDHIFSADYAADKKYW